MAHTDDHLDTLERVRLGWGDRAPVRPIEPDVGAGARRPGAIPSWRKLYLQLGEKVFRICLKLSGDEETARDLTHDTFLRAIERSGQYDSRRGTVEGWVCTIAANLARDWLRGPANRREAPLTGEKPVRSPESQVLSLATLERALPVLTESEREAVLLHHRDGYSHAEIGEMLGIKASSSRSRITRALVKMRDFL